MNTDLFSLYLDFSIVLLGFAFRKTDQLFPILPNEVITMSLQDTLSLVNQKTNVSNLSKMGSP